MDKRYVVSFSVKSILLIIVLLVENLFYVTNISGDYLRAGSYVLSVFLFFFAIARNRGINKNMLKYIVVVAIFLFSQLAYTLFLYKSQNLLDFLRSSQGYIYIILCWPIFYYMQKKQVAQVLDVVKYACFISLLIIGITALFYNMSGESFFHVHEYKTYLERNGRLRIWDLSSLEGVAIIWASYQALENEKNKFRNTMMAIIMFGCLIYVEQTRMMQMAIVIAVLVLFWKHEFGIKNEKWVKRVIIAFSMGIMIGTGVLDFVRESFSVTGKYARSTIIRLDEIKYGFEMWKQHPLMGNGLLLNSIRDAYIDYNGEGRFGYSDIGLWGLIIQVGVWAIPIYIMPMVKFYKVCAGVRKKEKRGYQFYLSLYIFLVITSMTLLVLNRSRIFMWPFCVALYEYGGICLKNDIEGE